MIRISNLSKNFTLHNQGGSVIPVMAGGTLRVDRGECVGLTGRSGSGKSTMMRMIYGNYLADAETLADIHERLIAIDAYTAPARAAR